MKNEKHKILLIEDNKLDQMAFKRFIEDEKLPYDCTIAGSVAQAKEVLEKGQFDVIISDYSLGDGTAFDIFGLVKDTPLIFVTGIGDEEIAVNAYKAGASDYLIKDLDRNYLKTVPITVENVIRHKRTEDQLRLLSGAIMSTEDAVYITDIENKIIFVNKAFCKAYGYNEDEVLGQDSQILWINKNGCTNTRSVFQTSGNTIVKFYHRRKDGTILPVSLSRAIIKDTGWRNIAVVSIAHDISEQILVEERLGDLNKKMQKQNQLRNDFVTRIYNALLNATAYLRDAVSSMQNTQQHTDMQSLRNSVEQLGKIVNDFSGIVQIETDKTNHAVSVQNEQACSPAGASPQQELSSHF